jgi:cytochrome P450
MCSSIFPNPEEFIPERCLPSGTKENIPGVKLDQYFLPFSTGNRDCIGNNLASAEIRFAIVGVVTFCDIEPANTQYPKQDMGWRDNIVASYSSGVRMAIRNRI